MPSIGHAPTSCATPPPDTDRTADPTATPTLQVSDREVTARPPVVVAVRVRKTLGGHAVTIVCPYCGSKHQHGLPADASDVGHRAAHCGPAHDVAGLGYTVELAGAAR